MCIWTIRKQGTNVRFLLQYVRIILRPETFSLEHLKNNFEPVDSNAKQTEQDSSGEGKTKGRGKESALIFLFIFIVPCFFACTRTRRPINELDPFLLSFLYFLFRVKRRKKRKHGVMKKIIEGKKKTCRLQGVKKTLRMNDTVA